MSIERIENLDDLLTEAELEEGGYSGSGGGTDGAGSFQGTRNFGRGGVNQLAGKLDPAVDKLKKDRDEEAGANFKQKQTRGRGYPSSRQTLGISDDGDVGPNNAHFPGDELDQVGKTPQKLDSMYVSDPTKDYWSGREVEDEPDVLADEEKNVIKNEGLNEQGGTAIGGGAGRSVASDGNYRDLQGFPRMNSIEEPMDFIPPVEGDVDGDGEEDEYLEDEEYVTDVLRLNGLSVKPGNVKKLFQDEELTEWTLRKVFLEAGSFDSPGYGPAERYKQGYWEEMPNGDDWLINHVDYSGGHDDIDAAEHSPGAHTYGNIATPKDFVPEDWAQRHPKTKEEPIDMETGETIEEMIERLVRESLGEAYTGIDDETGKGKATGGSEAFNKSRKDVLDYDEKQKPEGTRDLENYHLGDDDK